MQNYAIKFVLVGDSGVGKTQLLRRFGKKEFRKESPSTMNMEFSTRNILFERCTIKAQIWDTAGQERFESMTKAYFRDAMGAFLIYDVTDRDSFDHIKTTWLSQVKNFAHDKIQIVLVGNKSDQTLPAESRKVSKEDGVALAKELEVDFVETSAFDGVVEHVFRRCILSVAPVIPDVAIHLDLTGLPHGWITATPDMVAQAAAASSSGEGGKEQEGVGADGYSSLTVDADLDHASNTDNDDDDVKYCNYWTGEIRNSKPTEPADTGMIHAVKRKLLVSSDSFCARAVSADGNGNNDANRNSSSGNKEESFRLSNVNIVGVGTEDYDDDDLSSIEKLKSKCACVIL